MSSTSNPKVTIIDPDDGYPVNVTEDGLKVDVGSNIDIGTVTIGDVTVANPFDGAVTGTFWQATQPVSGAFYQATQPVSIASMPTTAVTGTFWQATQPVSGTFWQATQPVSGSITVGNTVGVANALPAALHATVVHSITTIASDEMDVTTAGTALVLSVSQACKKVDIQAKITNTGKIYIGGSTVDSDEGLELRRGDIYSLEIGDLNDVYVDCSVNGEGVRYTWYG